MLNIYIYIYKKSKYTKRNIETKQNNTQNDIYKTKTITDKHIYKKKKSNTQKKYINAI